MRPSQGGSDAVYLEGKGNKRNAKESGSRYLAEEADRLPHGNAK